MISNKNVMLINTNLTQKKLTTENFEKNLISGVYYSRCPETGKEIPFSWIGIKERNETRKFLKEFREENKLKLVS